VTLDIAGCSDGELAALALGGRQAAYGELMRRHRDSIYRFVRGHIGDADAAVDVTQQAFVAAFAALGRFDGARPFRLWLTRIAINKCRDWARRRAVRRMFAFALPIGAAADMADGAVAPDILLSNREDLQRTLVAIAALPAALKEPLILRTIDGLSQAETAQLLGIGEKAVETRLYRARARLKERLRD
jgi:RNA polymerase sigma-70 factor (ECF subfamily)